MKLVAVEELQSSLRECIAIVNDGEDLVFTQDGKPVARMTTENLPPEEAATDDKYDAHLRKLEAQGLIRSGTGKIPDDFWDLPLAKCEKGTLLDALPSGICCVTIQV